MHKNVPDEKRLALPKYCEKSSNVVQFLNMLSLEDLFDSQVLNEVKQDLLDECR